ncbi:DUF4397 domain-containing protein [Bacillus sp. FJAT-45066]|uniref:DUF4397 domain-containing protein n=1 Tax=Bacillus sp. FJAT-45066 TaxID=2011010 RepID=UPI0034E9440F
MVHASPDAPAVDVYVNGDLVVENAPFKAATDYLQVPAGTHTVEIFVAGTQENPVITAELTVEAGVSYTVAAIVQGENDTALTFIVKKVESSPYDAAPLRSIFGPSTNRQLNLITCSGTYNRSTQNHTERLVVYTELKGDH